MTLGQGNQPGEGRERRIIRLVMVARALRGAGYGWLSVSLALLLTARGMAPVMVGALLSVALGCGAAFAACSGILTKRFGRRRTLVGSSLVMIVSGLLLAVPNAIAATVVAVLIGTVSAGTQEVGPFGALEQTLVADAAPGRTTAIFGRYNLVGVISIAIGASFSAFIPTELSTFGYAAIGLALAVLYAIMPEVPPRAPVSIEDVFSSKKISGMVERLTALFALDAFGGGLMVQSFLAYWFVVRFGADQHTLGLLFFATNALGALGLLAAAPAVQRAGLIPTMVFTQLPMNFMMISVPFMPNFYAAAALLVAYNTISQIDKPARQTLVMTVVAPEDRPRAAGLTNAVRPGAAAFGPLISGLAISAASFGLPFFLAGGAKIVYNCILFSMFHGIDAELAAHGARTRQQKA